MSASHRGIMRMLASLGLALVIWSALAWAEPTVIYDNGQSRPITDYVNLPEPQPEPPLPSLPSADVASVQFLAGLFPIETPEMTPGPVTPNAVDLALPQPFFLVGSDSLSQQWLAQYRDTLAQAHAVGLVVNVATLQEYQALQKLAGDGIQLTPASGSDFLHLLQGITLSHYPVLISSQRIEQ